MSISNFITSEEACDLLGVSKPTWNKLRAENDITDYQSKRRVILFNKSEVLKKIVAKKPCTMTPVNLIFGNLTADLDEVKIDATTFDLRAINVIDPYGALSLLASIRAIVADDQTVNLIVDARTPTRYLTMIGLFKELTRSFDKFVFWDRSITDTLTDVLPEILYPLKVVGYRGQDKSSAEELARALMDQGFSETIAGYIGWILGELSDNSLTHSGDAPCYFLAARYPGQKNYLQIGILDSGIGIQNSLRKNPKYSEFGDRAALLSAFKPFVSSWPDTAGRGKGLTDVVTIALSNKGLFKVDSCDLSIMWDFSDLSRTVEFVEPMTKVAGVRFCFVLIDSDFDFLQDREPVESLINKHLEKL